MRKNLGVAFLLTNSLVVGSAYAADFLNGGFESGNLTNWTGGGGSFTQPLPNGVLLDASNFIGGTPTNAIVTTGYDPVLATASTPININMVYSGNYAVRVNNDQNDQSVSTISQTVTNYGSSTINFAWSAVLQGSGHPVADTDNFTLKIVDNTNNSTVSLISYNAAAGGSVFTSASTARGTVFYSGWQAESVNVTAGHDYTISLLAADCDAGGHFGYVYLDGFGLVAPAPGPVTPSTPDIVSSNNGQSGYNALSELVTGASSNFNNRFAGGTVVVDGTSTSQSPISTTANFTIASGVNQAFIDQNSNYSSFSGQIADDTTNGRLIIVNGNGSTTAGRVILATGNTYTGGTEVQAGATLSIANPSAIGTGGLDLVGSSSVPATLQTTASMTISAPITVSGDPVFDVVSGTTTISAPITDGGVPGDVVVSGAGTLALTAVNTYTGDTTIVAGGTLALSGSIASSGTATGATGVTNNGTFNVRGVSGNVALGGTLTQTSTGNLLMNISPVSNQKILVTGAASLAGGLSLNASAGSYTAGKYTLITASGVTGTFGTFSSDLSSYTRLGYALGYDANSVFLTFTPNVTDTQTSLSNSLASLQGLYNLQTSAINNGLSYDCSLFDTRGLCISTGGRYSNTNTPTGDSTGALVIGGYRVNDNVRVGAYLDQGISSSMPTGIHLQQHNPMFGAFGVWQASQDGLGAQVRVAAGYNDADMTVTRAVISTSEAGSGSTNLTSKAISVVGSYGVEMQGSWIVSPYAGARYTNVKADGYAEAADSSVTAPLAYANLEQSEVSLLAGIRWSGKLTDRVALNGSVGVEHDVDNSHANYTATGLAGLTPIVFNTDINKTRAVASVGTSVLIDKRQQLAFSIMYNEQAFSHSSTTSAYGTYTIGF